MEDLLAGLARLSEWQVIVALMVGALGGLIIGAVPGIGPAIAIAILLPATLFLDPLVSLVLLLGVYGSSMYGGAIPAILINTPGTPVNALTTYDGYSMTKRGLGARALSLAYSASFFGGVFSILVAMIALLVFGPWLKDLGSYFSRKEVFMAAMLGALLLIFAHRQNRLIALVLFMFGAIIAMVGKQSTKGIDRWTFGSEHLITGFHLIVIVVGIFAISQALNLLVGKDETPVEAKLKGGLFRGMTELRKHPIIATLSALYGTLMGIIPGVGEFVAQFFSYSTARALSKKPERFGHGSSEGLIASETANNAVPAAAMIPLLALGVPGEALTAMMLIVFRSRTDLTLGPDIFVNNADFLYSLFIALLIVNVVVVITLLFTTRLIARMIYIPNRFLGAFILILSFIGVFSINNNPRDCVIAAVAGLFGFILRRLDWPLVPIVLGMVLGDIMLRELLASAASAPNLGLWVSRPVAGTLAVGCIGVIIAIAVTSFNDRRRST